ncbi:MAG: hypothetical protein AAGB46_00245 [Verrucomicrobiota bacterium]
MYIIVAQVLALGLYMVRGFEFLEMMSFSPYHILQGQVWRLVSFILIPFQIPQGLFDYLFLAFGWYIFNMCCTALEQTWGSFKTTLYIVVWLLTVIVFGFLLPEFSIVRTSYGLYLVVFFAFAYLFPNIEFLMFFVLPVKVKWLGWISAGLVFLQASAGGVIQVLITAASFSSFFLFFGKEFLNTAKQKQRKAKFDAERKIEAATPFHVCSVCGVTDISDPDMNFRYRGDDAICERCIELEKEQESKKGSEA